MAWTSECQNQKDQLVDIMIALCRAEIGGTKAITSTTNPCHHLGICEEDLDDIQIVAAASIGLRPPLKGEPLVVPWHGPEIPTTIEDLAGWLASNSRPVPE